MCTKEELEKRNDELEDRVRDLEIELDELKDEHDKLASFQSSVAGYIVKPTDYKKFVEAIKTLDLYWTLSELPFNSA